MGGAFNLYLKEVVALENDPGDGSKLGLTDYPIPTGFNAAWRESLNQKIISHFWNREIGLETISMFCFNLRRKMWEIMPFYNQMYKSTQLQFDPMATVNVSTVRDGTANMTSTGNTNSAGTVNATTGGRVANSDFPQQMLEGDADYASSGSDTTGTAGTTSTGTGSTSNTDANTDHSTVAQSGSTVPGSVLLEQYRATFLNIDMDVIRELRELFMNVYSNDSIDADSAANPYGYYGVPYLRATGILF